MGQKKSKGRDEHEVTSLIKPSLISEAKDVVGFLDMGQSKESKPKTKAKLKKLAREKGPTDDTNMTDRENGLGTKHGSEIEALEVQKRKVPKKIRGELLLFAEQQAKETAMATGQHHRER